MEQNPFPIERQRVAILEHCFVGWPAARRVALLASGGFDESLHSAVDWECWARMILDGAIAGLADEPLSLYRIHEASLTASRVPALRQREAALAKLDRRTDLSSEERAALRRSLRVHRCRADLAEAHEAVRTGSRDARTRCFVTAVTGRQLPPAARVRLLAAAASPKRWRVAVSAPQHRPSILDRSVHRQDLP